MTAIPVITEEPHASLWSDAWRRLLKNRLATFGLVVSVLLVVVAV
ncbi:MAG: ABC transporter permease, partial [Rhizobiales bacterium]|nr:ABC transporter permease [Hyphomicrobiales bacterium]